MPRCLFNNCQADACISCFHCDISCCDEHHLNHHCNKLRKTDSDSYDSNQSVKTNNYKCFENEVAPSDCWKYLLTQNFSTQQINSIIATTLCTHCFMVDTTEMIPIMQNAMPNLQDCLQKLISRKNLSQISKEAAKKSNFTEIKTLRRNEDRRCIFEGYNFIY